VSDAAEDVIAVIRAGARGYVTKTISSRELVTAIARVAVGDAVFSPRLAGFVLDAFADRPGAAPISDPDLDLLTPRERSVITLRYGIGDGRSRTLLEVGKELGISRERVRQLEVVALMKLRGISGNVALRECV